MLTGLHVQELPWQKLGLDEITDSGFGKYLILALERAGGAQGARAWHMLGLRCPAPHVGRG